MKKVSVSFLSSKNVVNDLIDLEATDVDFIHVDVMDGKFVKNKNLPFKTLDRMSYVLKKRLDVHLMVKKPIKFIEKYATLNTEYITIHVELGDSINECLDLIKSYGIKCGLAINPDTDVETLRDYLDKIDMILVMSVVPGQGGQSFIEETTMRIDKIKDMIKKRKIVINVDGGINENTIFKVSKADIVVSGSYIISKENFQDGIDKLRK